MFLDISLCVVLKKIAFVKTKLPTTTRDRMVYQIERAPEA